MKLSIEEMCDIIILIKPFKEKGKKRKQINKKIFNKRRKENKIMKLDKIYLKKKYKD
jgi:hypothetical protein